MSWAHYILQVNIYLIVFYGFYKFLLERETYFTLNRVYLLSAGLLSTFIPLLRFEWFTTQPVAQPIYSGVDQFNELMTQVVVAEESTERLNPSDIIVIMYLIGVVFFIVRFIFRLYTVRRLLKRVTPGTAFSFFRKVTIDKNLPEVQTIEKHEEVHIRQLHTLDILFLEALGILNWFNPVIYFYKKSIKNIHEYLADEEAAKYQGDKEQYALLLLSTAFGVRPNQLTNSFFDKSFIKKRIYMLHKQRSKRTGILKYGLFVPLFAMTLILSSATIRENKDIQSIADQLPIGQPFNTIMNVVDETVLNEAPISSPKLTKAAVHDVQATKNTSTLKGLGQDWKQFYEHLTRKIKYPVEAQQIDFQGNSYIKFTISNGEIKDIGIAGNSLGYGCDTEVMSTILSYKDFNSSTDGKYILPVSFKLEGAETPVQNEKTAELKDYKTLRTIFIIGYGKSKASSSQEDGGDNKVHSFISIEKQPSFPGGIKKFYEYLSNNVKYPAEALKNKTTGNVYLSYIVEKDGSITDIKVDRKLGSGTDEEAVRVLNEMPKWIPGTQNGKPVRVKYNIPITFNLDKNGNYTSERPETPGITGGVLIGKGANSFLNIRSSRGESAPLFIVDGKKITDDEEMKMISPDDIESINVLKGEKSTALYGEEGKNGVVQITTKKNNKDSKKTPLEGTAGPLKKSN